MKRGLSVGVVVLLVAASAGTGWWFGRSIRSPAQIAAEAEPPDPSLITVTVERTELSANVITRADVGYDDPAILSLGGSLGGVSGNLVVTAAPRRGDDLAEGETAIEIAGRPVFLLEGPIPVFRDMRPGAVGPDVMQLEQSLTRLGFFDGEADQVWDENTETAVETWYQARGYQANGISEQEQTSLKTARNRVKSADDSLRAARKSLTDAERGPTDAQLRQARSAVTDAQENWNNIETSVAAADAAARSALSEAEQSLEELEAGPTDKQLRQARAEAADAGENLRKTELRVAEEDAAAARAVLDAERARETAARSYAEAESGWRSAQMGVHPEGGNIPTPAQLESLRLAVNAARMSLEEAEKAITDAREAVAARPRQAESDMRAARNRQLDAQEALNDLLNPPNLEDRLARARQTEADARAALARRPALAATERRTARNRLLDAQDALNELLRPPDLAALQSGADDAETELDAARNDLAKLEADYGTWIPAGEVIFLKRMPVRVDALTSELGSRVSGGFMTVTGSDLAVRGSVLVRDVSLVREGGEARIEDPSLTDPIPGVIRLLENRPGTRNVASDRHYMEITSTEEIPDDLVGKNVRIVIPVGGTEGEVWAVPAAALSATADGAVRIEIAGEDGSSRFVEVTPGLAAQGLVEITPLNGEIKEGDQVVVGVASGA